MRALSLVRVFAIMLNGTQIYPFTRGVTGPRRLN